MKEIKYCPNCLWECNESLDKTIYDKWYWCDKCWVLVYSRHILLNSPDEIEKSRIYRIGNITGIYNAEEIYEELKEIFK